MPGLAWELFLTGWHTNVLRYTFATQYLRANPDDLHCLVALMCLNDLNTVMVYAKPTLQNLSGRKERTGQMQIDWQKYGDICRGKEVTFVTKL